MSFWPKGRVNKKEKGFHVVWVFFGGEGGREEGKKRGRKEAGREKISRD